jgi:hypothetical protein
MSFLPLRPLEKSGAHVARALDLTLDCPEAVE